MTDFRWESSKEHNEREITHWQTGTTETEQLALELTLYMDRFIVLRTGLYLEGENENPASQGGCTPMPHTRFELVFSP